MVMAVWVVECPFFVGYSWTAQPGSFEGRMPRRATRPPPLLADFDDEEREAVLAANRAFYRAFSERDAEAMDQIWAPTGAVVCLHPGQAPLHGRVEIMASWRAILSPPQGAKVRCLGEWIVRRPGLG